MDTLAKDAKALITANEKIPQRRRIIGEYLQDFNPYQPKWDPNNKITAQKKVTRTAGHIRKLVIQWKNCAAKSMNEGIKQLYTNRLEQVEGQERGKWMHLVYKIIFDSAHKAAPKVLLIEKEEIRVNAQKRRAGDGIGPVGKTPELCGALPKRPQEGRQEG